MNIYLSLGSNLPDRYQNLEQAVRMIHEKIGPVTVCSSIYESEPWGFQADKMFLNMVVELETELNPQELLQVIGEIEYKLGRTRNGNGYQSRTIDIDILFYSNWIVIQKDLVIPHRQLQNRKFVLLPLAELNPDLQHPILRRNIRDLLDKCNDVGTISKIGRYQRLHQSK